MDFADVGACGEMVSLGMGWRGNIWLSRVEKRTNEWTQERINESTNKQTNKQTSNIQNVQILRRILVRMRRPNPHGRRDPRIVRNLARAAVVVVGRCRCPDVQELHGHGASDQVLDARREADHVGDDFGGEVA